MAGRNIPSGHLHWLQVHGLGQMIYRFIHSLGRLMRRAPDLTLRGCHSHAEGRACHHSSRHTKGKFSVSGTTFHVHFRRLLPAKFLSCVETLRSIILSGNPEKFVAKSCLFRYNLFWYWYEHLFSVCLNLFLP
jgi:hypothetical protein